MPVRRTVAFLVFVCCAATGRAQTTQALVAGSVLDRLSGMPVAHASVTYRNDTTGENGSAVSNASGHYALPLLSPGAYRIACSAPGYQPAALWNLDLAIAGRLELSFHLRPLTDVWESGQYRGVFFSDSETVLTFFGPDLDPGRSSSFEPAPYSHGFLESSISTVIDPGLIRNLPLAGRDVYSTLAVNPGVAADTTTGRGLGLSVNGQRPASSNFLLDGVENNNTLVTGPLTSLAAEMIQEYRVSISAWSAEYGRTAGYLANAITRAGGESWHGVTYFNLKNTALNASDFERNAHGEPRSPFHEAQYGFQTGGPLWRKRLFLSTGLEAYRSRSESGTVGVNLPTGLFVSQLSKSNPAHVLFARFPTPAAGVMDDYVANVAVRPTISIDRKLALARADYIAGPRRFSVRAAINRTDWPDFIWYPYPDFRSGLEEPAASVVAGYIAAMGASVTHEARASFSRATTRWDRPHSEIPTLVITETLLGPNSTLQDLSEPTLLPGSPALYGFRNTGRTVQFTDSWLWTGDRHIAKAGGGLFVRNPNGLMTTGKGGRYSFNTIVDFLIDNPATVTAALSRTQLPNFAAPDYDRYYRNTQYFLFAQDTWRVSRRFVLNGGIRYENFGAPLNTGAVLDPTVKLGPGRTLDQSLATASLAVGPRRLWSGSGRDFAPRFGFAYDGSGWYGPVIRGGYGVYYDRLFDNLWTGVQNNGVVVPPSFDCGIADCANYLAPVNTVIRQFSETPFDQGFPALTLIDPKLRSGLVQSYFLSAAQRLSENLGFEVDALGSRGRGLVTTDIVNRSGGVINPALPEIYWRSNQGSSDYHALVATARYRPRRGELQASWTWSHVIDNQSDPLQGEFFDLSIVNFSGRQQLTTSAAFSRQFDSSIDRGSADFDQRHNFVVSSWFDLPAPHGSLWAFARNWRVAEVAAFRSGFPFTVLAPSTGAIANQRADLTGSPVSPSTASGAQPGSFLLLDRRAFAAPPEGVLGNTGRNAFRGPGLWSVDASISRSAALPKLGESARLTLRADFYNALNHANLNNPVPLITSPTFGQATRGRTGRDTGFPALIPLNETARQVQLVLKIEF